MSLDQFLHHRNRHYRPDQPRYLHRNLVEQVFHLAMATRISKKIFNSISNESKPTAGADRARQKRAKNVNSNNCFILSSIKNRVFSVYLYGHLRSYKRLLSFVLVRYVRECRMTSDDYSLSRIWNIFSAFCAVRKTNISYHLREKR